MEYRGTRCPDTGRLQEEVGIPYIRVGLEDDLPGLALPSEAGMGCLKGTNGNGAKQCE